MATFVDNRLSSSRNIVGLGLGNASLGAGTAGFSLGSHTYAGSRLSADTELGLSSGASKTSMIDDDDDTEVIVVSDGGKTINIGPKGAHPPGCCNSEAHCSNYMGAPPMPTIFDAVKAGLLIPVQTLVESNGVEVLGAFDEKGMTPAHWACIRGHKLILQYIVDMKGPYDLPSRNELGQRPIHWACINGHIAIVDLLIELGVCIDSLDVKLCTPLIIAAQYGQTMMVGYLIGKGAKLHATDCEGDTALHWAAFKGHNELMRLLVYSGLSPHQLDNFGQAPLHLACINGSLHCVKELCEQDKVEVNIADKKGKTPVALAIGRKHDHIVDYLKKESRRRFSLLPSLDLWSVMFGPPGQSRGAFLFLLANILLWGYPTYIIKYVPVLWSEQELMNIVFIGVNIMMWISLYCSATLDPGYIQKNMPEYDLCLKQVSSYDEWRGTGVNPLSRLCHTCRCVRPTRAKHCRVCNRCVVTFDHHCPYVNNCVGYNNRGWFFVFLTCIFINLTLSEYFILSLLYTTGWDLVLVLGLTEVSFFFIITGLVFILTLYNIRLNLTTNERFNHSRYKYLQDSKGRYYNPYDRGVKRNTLEFFHLAAPLNDQQVNFLNVTIL